MCVYEPDNPKHAKAILAKLKLGHLSWGTAETASGIYDLHPDVLYMVMYR